jgi:hypothetical protein
MALNLNRLMVSAPPCMCLFQGMYVRSRPVTRLILESPFFRYEIRDIVCRISCFWSWQIKRVSLNEGCIGLFEICAPLHWFSKEGFRTMVNSANHGFVGVNSSGQYEDGCGQVITFPVSRPFAFAQMFSQLRTALFWVIMTVTSGNFLPTFRGNLSFSS